MNVRYFTLDEARDTLPKVKALMEQVQVARRQLMEARGDLWPAIRKAATNGGNHEASAALQHYNQLEAGIKGLQALGVLVKDVDQGLVDFLGVRDGREVYLCWRYGEQEITFWHELNAGFAGRHPIDESVT